MRDEVKFFKVPPSDNDIVNDIKELYEVEKKIKALNCVSCWNRSNGESVALWKIYSDFNKGIMIKSSISRLENALQLTEEEIKLSEVRYIDYEKEVMPDGNTMYPLIHKQTAYSYEDEVRLIHEVSQDGWIHDWTKEEIEEGIFINTDLNSLISEIVISPYSPKWFLKLIEELSKKYDLNKPIKESKLAIAE